MSFKIEICKFGYINWFNIHNNRKYNKVFIMWYALVDFLLQTHELCTGLIKRILKVTIANF